MDTSVITWLLLWILGLYSFVLWVLLGVLYLVILWRKTPDMGFWEYSVILPLGGVIGYGIILFLGVMNSFLVDYLYSFSINYSLIRFLSFCLGIYISLSLARFQKRKYKNI